LTDVFSTALYPYFLGELFVIYLAMMLAMVAHLRKEHINAGDNKA